MIQDSETMERRSLSLNYSSDLKEVYSVLFNDIVPNLKISEQTLHLSLDLFYNGIQQLDIQSDHYSLLSATCLGLASKLDEIEGRIPDIETLIRNFTPQAS